MAVVRELFIYWRTAPHDAAAAIQAVAAAQAALRQAHPGLQARLLQRSDADGAQVTLMETYGRAARGIDLALQDAIETAAGSTARWRVGARHLEVFDALSD
jgi:hypothetical protein